MPVDFLGLNDGINFGAVTGVDLAALTILAWIKPNSIGHNGVYGVIATKYGASGGWGSDIVTGGGYTRALRIIQSFSGADGVWLANIVITLGVWQHVAISYDNSLVANDSLIYVNGISKTVTEDNTPTGTATDGPGEDWVVGNRNVGGGAYDAGFDGEISNLMVYNRILPVEEILSHYNSRQFMVNLNGLVFWIPMWGAAGLQSYDGATLLAANKIVDQINGLKGTPNDSPAGTGEIILSY